MSEQTGKPTIEVERDIETGRFQWWCTCGEQSRPWWLDPQEAMTVAQEHLETHQPPDPPQILDDTPQEHDVWRHFKEHDGGLYTVLSIAAHSEDESAQVVYQSHHDGRIWVRPMDEWHEQVEKPNDPATGIPRFTLITRLWS